MVNVTKLLMAEVAAEREGQNCYSEPRGEDDDDDDNVCRSISTTFRDMGHIVSEVRQMLIFNITAKPNLKGC